VPVSKDHGHVLLVTTKPLIPDVAEELRMIFNLPVRCVICTPAELSAAIAAHYPRGTARMIKAEHSKELPPTAEKKKSKPVVPMNDESKKDRLLITVATFNFTVAFAFFAAYYLPLPKGMVIPFGVLMLSAVVIGGVAASVAWKMRSR
jgi:hypothetical protein